MKKNYLKIRNIPAIIWGSPSHHVYFFVHGKMANKEDAQGFAEIATSKGFQVISFDLPEHGDRKNEEYPCNIQNSVHDLTIIATYAVPCQPPIPIYSQT